MLNATAQLADNNYHDIFTLAARADAESRDYRKLDANNSRIRPIAGAQYYNARFSGASISRICFTLGLPRRDELNSLLDELLYAAVIFAYFRRRA